MPHVRGDCVCRCHMSDVCHVVPVQVRQIVRQRFPISRQLLSSGFVIGRVIDMMQEYDVRWHALLYIASETCDVVIHDARATAVLVRT